MSCAPKAIYGHRPIDPAYQLRYAWTAWPSREGFPSRLEGESWQQLLRAWEGDGIRVIEDTWKDEMLQILFSAKPNIPPVFIAARAKGRLQHAYRNIGSPCDFSRKLSIRSVGDNTTQDVENYIANQVRRGQFVDEAFAEFLDRFTVHDSGVDLALPTVTRSGRYWYNLHLVLVTAERSRLILEEDLRKLSQNSLQIARKKDYRISVLSPMPDHLHIALRGNIHHSPQDIATAFQNNLAYAFGQKPIWEETYYVGTFSEYDVGGVRAAKKKSLPLG